MLVPDDACLIHWHNFHLDLIPSRQSSMLIMASMVPPSSSHPTCDPSKDWIQKESHQALNVSLVFTFNALYSSSLPPPIPLNQYNIITEVVITTSPLADIDSTSEATAHLIPQIDVGTHTTWHIFHKFVLESWCLSRLHRIYHCEPTFMHDHKLRYQHWCWCLGILQHLWQVCGQVALW